MPSNVGQPIGGQGYRSFQLEIHYNNPWRDAGVSDSSGINVFYTSQRREHDLGVLQLGDPFLLLGGTPVGDGLTEHHFSCSGECSQVALADPITVIRESLHMHQSGTRMYNSQVRNGEVIRTANVDFFDFDQQGSFATVQPPYQIQAGDGFETSCYYRSNGELFGLSSQQEMCIAYLWYYPRATFGNFPLACGFGFTLFPPCNPSWESISLGDELDLGRTFGESGDSCPTDAPAVQSDVPSAAPTRRRPVFCFSGHDTVVTKNQGTIAMRALQIGQQVLVGDNQYEKVYSFGHHHETLEAEFLQIHLDRTRAPLEISANHMLFVETDRSVPASMLTIGDKVVLGSGEEAHILAIKSVVRKGVFAPFTPSGKIVVNGVLSSTFIAMQESDRLKIGNMLTPWSLQWLAHSFEALHRINCVALGTCENERYTKEGISEWVALPFRLSQWLVQQNPFVWLLVLVPAVLVVVLISLVEMCLLDCKCLAAIVLGWLVVVNIRRSNTKKP